MKLIGKGSFTKAYLTPENDVMLKSIDPIKECMAHGWFPDSPLFPELEFIGSEMYKMKYYPKKSSLKNNLDADQYQIYKDLRSLDAPYVNPHMLFDSWYKEFNKLEDKELAETMIDALHGCSNYGSDICFEISPRNVATDNGKLILLDCFYIKSKLDSLRKG